MTPAEFRSAIRKGQGRVIQRLRAVSGEPYLDIIEHACTHHLAYDPQCEGSREEYLLEVTGYVGGLERFRGAILRELQTATDYWDSSQLFALARRLATAGDQEAREAMYSRFASSFREKLALDCAAEFIRLDGRRGLHFIATTMGKECQSDPKFSPDDVRWHTDESFAEGQIEIALNEMANDDSVVRAYLDRVRVDEYIAVARPSDEELERMSFDEVMSIPHSSSYLMQRWGKSAATDELTKAALALEQSNDREQIQLLLGTFRHRTFPRDPGILLRMLEANAADQMISRRFELALQRIASPVVRETAIRLLESGQDISRALYLLSGSYKRGDADLVVRSLPSKDENAEVIHEITHPLLDLFEGERASDGTDALLWIWERGPCALCRMTTYERLDSIGCVPNWVRQEAIFDCYEDLRKLARGKLDASK